MRERLYEFSIYKNRLVRSRAQSSEFPMSIEQTAKKQKLTAGLLLVFVFCSSNVQPQSDPEPQSATVQLQVEFNRPFIDLEFERPDGSARKARFWVDTGGGAFFFCERLARDIGMKFGEQFTEEGGTIAATTPPLTRLGRMVLNVDGARTFITMGKEV